MNLCVTVVWKGLSEGLAREIYSRNWDTTERLWETSRKRSKWGFPDTGLELRPRKLISWQPVTGVSQVVVFKTYCSSFFLYVSECFAFMYLDARHAYLVSTRPEEGIRSLDVEAQRL